MQAYAESSYEAEMTSFLLTHKARACPKLFSGRVSEQSGFFFPLGCSSLQWFAVGADEAAAGQSCLWDPR